MNGSYMKRAAALSITGMQLGHGGPFGAVVVRRTAVVGEGWNEVLRSNDPTAHAEVVAIRNACRNLKMYDLSSCEIYCSFQRVQLYSKLHALNSCFSHPGFTRPSQRHPPTFPTLFGSAHPILDTNLR